MEVEVESVVRDPVSGRDAGTQGIVAPKPVQILTREG